MNPRELSYNEFHNIESMCQVCNRYLDGRRSIKACSLCFAEVKQEFLNITKEAEEQRAEEERQTYEWVYKFQKVLK